MKKIMLYIFNTFVILLFISLVRILNVSAATNPYGKNQTITMDNGQKLTTVSCTWYAWQQAYEKMGVALPGWGNAKTWYNSAKNAGYTVGKSAKPNSIVVYENSNDNYGHVAFVTKVEGLQMYVNEGGVYDWEVEYEHECVLAYDELGQATCDYGKITKTYIPYNGNGIYNNNVVPSSGNRSTTSKILGFIYLDKAPKKPTTSNNNASINNNSNNKITNTQTVVKSNNANLSSLTISDVELEFNKDTLKYEIEVKNKVEKISISAKPEDNKAKIVGTGKYDLKLGENNISVVVTAENGIKKTYTIIIKRLDNNANLSSLTISNVDFKFDKDVLDYNLEVDEKIKSITIEAIAESELATIESAGNYNLKIGENIIDVKVIAEDETEKSYVIKINRKEKIQGEEKIKTNDNHKHLIIYVVSGIIFVVLVIGIILIIKRRKKINK